MEAVTAGATLGEVTRSIRIQDGQEPPITPVKMERAAAPFETLRLQVEANAIREGRRPSVFLAAMGPRKQYKARADFSKAFFETAGFDIVYPAGFGTIEEAVTAAVRSGAVAAVICSTDETYPLLVAPLVEGMKALKPAMAVILAGYPLEELHSYRQAGVDDFIHVNANVVDVLSRLLQKAGIS